MLKIKRNL